uniref:Uncharacterized protein n=1 Tax=Salix viminalis TaxID=40686 RepID=A0A6N2KQ87_SALVM
MTELPKQAHHISISTTPSTTAFTRAMQMRMMTTLSNSNNAPLSTYPYRIALLIPIETGNLAKRKFKL